MKAKKIMECNSPIISGIIDMEITPNVLLSSFFLVFLPSSFHIRKKVCWCITLFFPAYVDMLSIPISPYFPFPFHYPTICMPILTYYRQAPVVRLPNADNIPNAERVRLCHIFARVIKSTFPTFSLHLPPPTYLRQSCLLVVDDNGEQHYLDEPLRQLFHPGCPSAPTFVVQ